MSTTNQCGLGAVPVYVPVSTCPWSGVPCDCKDFPWLDGEQRLPPACSNLIRTKAQPMEQFRKLAKKG